MLRTLRKIAVSVAALALMFALLCGVVWWTIHTASFARLVRSRLISEIQRSTGGRVELGSFEFDPNTLHATITNLVVHGTEPPGSAPLASIDKVDVGLKILSVWRHSVDIESVTVARPQIHLLINPDGTTNIASPAQTEDPMQQLLNLKMRHFAVNRGIVQINDRKVPLDFTSQDIALLLNYNYSGPSYGVSLRTGDVRFAISGWPLKPMRISTNARLFKDRADIEAFTLATENSASTIQLTGKVEHFAQPSAAATLDASLSINELMRLAETDQLQSGVLTLHGPVHLNGASGKFIFDGQAHARNTAFVSPEFTLRHISADANLVANNDGILLHHAEGGVRGARFSGEGSVKSYAFLQVAGQVSRIPLFEVGSFLTNKPFPWSGTAHGTAHASAHLTDKEPDFIIGGQVQIDEEKTGIPTSGNVDITFHARDGGKVEFGDSTLHLPHSNLNFQGTLETNLSVKADTSELGDLRPILPILGVNLTQADLPTLTAQGSAKFNGTLLDLLHHPVIEADLAIDKFKYRNYDWDSLTTHFTHSPTALLISRFQIQQLAAKISGNGSLELSNWAFNGNSPLTLKANFESFDVVKTAALFTTASLPVIQGLASGGMSLQGTLNNPGGTASVHISNLDTYGEQLNQVEFAAALAGDRLQISKGKLQSGPAFLSFAGSYEHAPANWSAGNVDLHADSNGFPLSGLSTVRKYLPSLNARAEVHLQATGKVRDNFFEPLKINGDADFSRVSVNGRELGAASLKAVTEGAAIRFNYTGDLRSTKFHGAAEARLTTGTPIHGDLQLDRIGFATLKALLSETKLVLPLDGYLDGSLQFDGLLEEPERINARATIPDLQISSTSSIVLHNREPIQIAVSGGMLNVTNFEMDGRATSVKITGSAPLYGDKPISIKAVGKADLALFALFDSRVQSSGSSELDANITGTLAAPNVTGSLLLRNGAFFLPDLPNGLSDVNGTVLFSRNRATIQKMTARSGGGDLSLGGSLNFGSGTPLVYHLEAAARNVRVRYANSISVTANSDLRLSGTSASSILSGTLTVTRVVFTPNADAGNLLAAAGSSASSPDQGDFISGLHLDIGIESAPNLQLSTNLSRDVEAELLLRLRGTPEHPIVLGTITANQGDLKIFGTRFSLIRGEVNFVNTVRVEPVLDLDLETQARGVTVDITVSGTPTKLNFNYRSDPPLQPRDIIALLTVGRTPDVGTTSNVQSGSDVGALTSGVNTVLGQAISPVSNRLSKLFGITNIKIDPFVQGITNTPQARLSVEQQISRDVTITYVTNLSQTSEQIFRFEWALNRQFSIVALRDDNGEFGIDFQYKKRFK